MILLVLLLADFPTLFNTAYQHVTAGRFAEAAPLLEQAARLNPRDFNTRFLLGQSYLKLNRPDDALRQWRVALEIQPANIRLMQVMIVEYENGLYYAEAEALARKALDLDPADLNLYLLAIHACQNARDLPTGFEIARRAAARFPGSARANFEYGFHLQRAGQPAEQYLKKAMELDRNYEEPCYFYGDLLTTQGRDEEAIPYLRRAIEIRSGYVAAHISLARALMHLERWQDAVAELEATAKIDPAHPEPHLMLSRLYFRMGDESRAAAEKELSLKLRRENPHALEAAQGRAFH